MDIDWRRDSQAISNHITTHNTETKILVTPSTLACLHKQIERETTNLVIWP